MSKIVETFTCGFYYAYIVKICAGASEGIALRGFCHEKTEDYV